MPLELERSRYKYLDRKPEKGQYVGSPQIATPAILGLASSERRKNIDSATGGSRDVAGQLVTDEESRDRQHSLHLRSVSPDQDRHQLGKCVVGRNGDYLATATGYIRCSSKVTNRDRMRISHRSLPYFFPAERSPRRRCRALPTCSTSHRATNPLVRRRLLQP